MNFTQDTKLIIYSIIIILFIVIFPILKENFKATYKCSNGEAYNNNINCYSTTETIPKPKMLLTKKCFDNFYFDSNKNKCISKYTNKNNRQIIMDVINQNAPNNTDNSNYCPPGYTFNNKKFPNSKCTDTKGNIFPIQYVCSDNDFQDPNTYMCHSLIHNAKATLTENAPLEKYKPPKNNKNKNNNNN